MAADPWNTALRKALLARGVGYTDDGKCFLLPNYGRADQPSQAAIDACNARIEFSRVYPTQRREWIRDLRHTIARLLAGDSNDASAVRAVFWLRLRGVLVDLREHPAFQVVSSNATPPRPGSDLERFTMWVSSMNAVRAILSENELLWAEYRRHVEAHIHQGAYEPQLNKKKSAVKAKFTSKYTEKTYDVHDLDNRLGAVLAAHRNSEPAIALDFARRLREPVERLYFATELMFA